MANKSFRQALRELINKHGIEEEPYTPDYNLVVSMREAFLSYEAERLNCTSLVDQILRDHKPWMLMNNDRR